MTFGVPCRGNSRNLIAYVAECFSVKQNTKRIVYQKMQTLTVSLKKMIMKMFTSNKFCLFMAILLSLLDITQAQEEPHYIYNVNEKNAWTASLSMYCNDTRGTDYSSNVKIDWYMIRENDESDIVTSKMEKERQHIKDQAYYTVAGTPHLKLQQSIVQSTQHISSFTLIISSLEDSVERNSTSLVN